MSIFSVVRREFFYLRSLLQLLSKLKSIEPDSAFLTPDLFERSVDSYKKRVAFIDENSNNISYLDFDQYANRVAHWAIENQIEPDHTVVLYMGNRWEYVAIWYGLSKVGVQTALINNQLTAQALAHTINISDAQHAIIEGELLDQYISGFNLVERPIKNWVSDGASTQLADAADFDSSLDKCETQRPGRSRRAHLKAKDPCLKMYTSGTTGLPKAAIVAHTRALYYLQAFGLLVHSKPKDRMMMVLPLYHATGGLCGVGSALSFGGAVIVRRKFSATKFWQDAIDHNATLFMYVGELCRFLVTTDPHPLEKKHKIRAAIGNGLRPDVWPRFVERTNIGRILEFYGATEGNVGLINLDSKQGSIGRIPQYLKHRFNIKLVRFDTEIEDVIRNDKGQCTECAPDEVGEAIGEIRHDDARYRFDGYQDEEATKKKVIRNVFKDGDAYFRTGDLMKCDKAGYFYFIDRVGDTFRWKSENVSTNEVAEVLGLHAGIVQANVYGVEVADYSGKAGMAALIINDKFDLEGLHRQVHEELPHYARPLFLRLQEDTHNDQTTGTFKLKKTELVKQGWSPDEIDEPIYFDCSEQKAYIPLTSDLREKILSGARRV